MSYKVGDIIAGKYRVTRDFNSAGGGTCQWGFAVMNYTEYFVKKFLTPVYPTEKSSRSEQRKQKRREHCVQFEERHKAIQDALSVVGSGGLVVKTEDFFRYGNEYGEHYFKVCQKIDTSSLSDQIHKLDIKERLLVMTTAAFALKVLHLRDIIHLDLKQENILIQKHNDKHIAKIIDFDSSILKDQEMAADFLVGDPVYYSPEVAKYIASSGETEPPTEKSDIFSLGLVFCQYWTGKLPDLATYNYAYEAVLNGEELSISEKTPQKTRSRIRVSNNLRKVIKKKNHPEYSIEQQIHDLVTQMLASNPANRLSASEVHEKLKEIQRSCSSESEDKFPRIRTSIKKTLRKAQSIGINVVIAIMKGNSYLYKKHRSVIVVGAIKLRLEKNKFGIG